MPGRGHRRLHTIAQPGEFRHETWENGSREDTGNTGAWGPLGADKELGYLYDPVETPTGDFYGGHWLGNNLRQQKSCRYQGISTLTGGSS
jgi:hypothetical protein